MRLDPETQAAVSRLARELGLTEAELVRRMLELTCTLRALIWLRGPIGGREA